MGNRIDPSISLEDEEDGQKFFDAVFAIGTLPVEAFDALESLDYSTAAKIYRAVRSAAA